MRKLEITIDNEEKKMTITSEDMDCIDKYSYKTTEDITKLIDEYLEKEVVDFCPICGEPIYDDDETMNDDSDSYGGDCHEVCFLDAQESRLG